MKISFSCLLSFAFLLLLSISCKKDDIKVNQQLPTACILQSESTGLSGNQMSWTYEYDNSGNLSIIKQFNSYGTQNATLEVSGSIVSKSNIYGPAVPQASNSISYEGDASLLKPVRSFISSQEGDLFTYNYRTYFFFYDAKGRLIRVGEQTDNVIGDLEYDLEIGYNDQDNVTSLYYNITTGPANTGSRIHVDAYDDKPTPYSGIPNWKFILNNYDWDHNDPEPILTALSRNNPLDYTLNEGTAGEYKRTMTYEYNNDGYPTKRFNTNKNASGEYMFIQTFDYLCN